MSGSALIKAISERTGAIDKSFSGIKKKAFKREFKKKHIQNARALENERRISLIFHTVNSWLKSNQCVSDHAIKEYIRCIKQLVKLMGYRYKKNLLLPTVIYADKFVKKDGLIDESDIFRVLLVSALVTVKFWEDTGIDADLASYVSGFTKKEICDLERRFLNVIDYKLFLDNSDIEMFDTSSPVSTPPSSPMFVLPSFAQHPSAAVAAC
jgi:hypothetical protein